MSQALYRKWRPQTWEDVLGQEHITRTLRNAVAGDRVAHAYLFSGPRGTGKTTTARLLAKAVNCLHEDLAARPCNQCAHCQAVNENRFMDLIEIDAASNNGVEDVRDLRDKINFAPSQGRYKIYIIDEVHMLSTAAFNALLKTLEEPPAHALFILATTEIHKIPATVLSRCQRHEFRRLPQKTIIAQLQAICAGENIRAEPAALALIARHSAGGMRDAISLLDQMAASGDEITLAQVQTVLGASADEIIFAVVDALLDGVPADGLDAIHRAIDGGSDPRALARQMVAYLREVLLLKMSGSEPMDVSEEVRQKMRVHAERFGLRALVKAVRTFNEAANEARAGWQPSLGLELALAESLLPSAAAEQEAVSRPAAESVARAAASPRPAASPKMKKSAPKPPPESPPRVEKSALEALRPIWKDVLDAIRGKNGALNGLLQSAVLHELKDDRLILAMPSKILVEKLDKAAYKQLTEQVLAEKLGRPLHVQVILSSGNQVGQAFGPMVSEALRQGGKITP